MSDGLKNRLIQIESGGRPLASYLSGEAIEEIMSLVAEAEQAAELRGAIKALKKSHGSAMISYKTDHSFEFVRGWNSHRSEVMKELARLAKLQATKPEKED